MILTCSTGHKRVKCLEITFILNCHYIIRSTWRAGHHNLLPCTQVLTCMVLLSPLSVCPVSIRACEQNNSEITAPIITKFCMGIKMVKFSSCLHNLTCSTKIDGMIKETEWSEKQLENGWQRLAVQVLLWMGGYCFCGFYF